MIVAGVIFLVLTGLTAPRPSEHNLVIVLFLAAGTQLAALAPIRWTRGVQWVIAPPLVAIALYAPGGLAPALTCWLCTYDGRRPGRDLPWWAALYNRANLSLSYGLPALVIEHLVLNSLIDLPARTLLFGLLNVVINYYITALGFAYLSGGSILGTLAENIGFGAVRSLLILSFAGGILYAVLNQPGGYVLSLGLLGFVFSVRANMADAQQQAVARIQTLELAAQALDARDRYTESHSMRVADLAARLGSQLELTGSEVELLRTAGNLHDLGKIGVRDSILNKAGPLTPDEWEEMRRHPDIGADMIERHTALAAAAPFVRYHHERWDGTGYPAGIAREAIPLGARILAVADSFDTITADRIYRRSHMTALEGVQDISSRSSRWYDPAVVDALRALHSLEPLSGERVLPIGLAVRPTALLRQPRFLRLFVSSGISSLGDPLTLTAAMTTLYGSLHQPLALASAFAAQAAAAILVGTFGSALPDRWRRNQLIPALEFARAILLFIVPLILVMRISSLALIPVLFLLAAAEGIVQPARQAAVPEVVDRRMIGIANAALAAISRFTWAAGAGVALVVLVVTHSAVLLFVADGVTFLCAGLLVIGIGNIGGGVPVAAFKGVARAWSVRPARWHLVLAAASAFFLSMSFPALVVLAYERSPKGFGNSGYGLLQFALGIGVGAGALLVSRSAMIGSMRTAAIGLAITAAGSVFIAFSAPLWVTALLLFTASIGNSFYTVANQTALLQTGMSSNRGSIMSFRFGLGQSFVMAGTAVGGILVQRNGAGVTYALLGVGLLLLAGAAFGLSTIEPRRPLGVIMGSERTQAPAMDEVEEARV